MKTKLMALAALGVAIASTASATESRLRSISGGAAGLRSSYKNVTFLDDRNIFVLPAELVKYGEWAAVETGDIGYTSFGFHYNFTPTLVLAMYGTSQDVPALNLGAGGDNLDQSGCGFCINGDAGATHKGTIILGVDTGSVRLGFLLAAWADMAKDFDADENLVKNEGPLVVQFAAGLGVGTAMGDLDFALDLKIGLPTHEGLSGGDTAEPLTEQNQIDVGLLFRGTFPFSGPHELVPYVNLDVAFGSSTNLANDQQKSGLHFGVDLGMDIRLNLGDGITVQPGLGFGGRVTSIETTPDGGDPSINRAHEFALPFYSLAVDVKVTDWFDIRFGGAQRVYWTWTSGEDGNGDPIASNSQANVDHFISTGVAFNLPAGVSIDVEVNNGWWRKGPYLLSGDGGGFGMSAAISKDW